jgi:hypothetical protein
MRSIGNSQLSILNWDELTTTRLLVVGRLESVLKGRGFSRAVNAQTNSALSRCGDVFLQLTYYTAGLLVAAGLTE